MGQAHTVASPRELNPCTEDVNQHLENLQELLTTYLSAEEIGDQGERSSVADTFCVCQGLLQGKYVIKSEAS